MLKGLDGNKVNEVSNAVIELLQGQGGALSQLLSSTSIVHHDLAARDQLIGDVINHLNAVLATVDEKGTQFNAAVDQLQQLITGLAQGSDPIAGAIGPLASAESDLTDMLANGRRPVQGVIENLRPLAENLDNRKTDVNKVIEPLAENYLRLNALGAYGSFFNIYYCSIRIKINGPAGSDILIPFGGPPDPSEGRCSCQGPLTTDAIPSAPESSASSWWRASSWCPSATPRCRSGRRARPTTAYFTDAGGISPGNDVSVSGIKVGAVKSVGLAGTAAKVTFTVDRDVRVGDQSLAAIKTDTVLGEKSLEITPTGGGSITTIPLGRTTTPYTLNAALQDLGGNTAALDKPKFEPGAAGADRHTARRHPAVARCAGRHREPVAHPQRPRRSAGESAVARSLGDQDAGRPGRPGEPAHRRR